MDHGRPPDGLRGADAGGQALALHHLPLPPGIQRILGDRRINPAERGKRREASRGWKGVRQGPFADLSSGKGAILPGPEGVRQAAFRGFLAHGGEGGPGAGVAGPGGGARRVGPVGMRGGNRDETPSGEERLPRKRLSGSSRTRTRTSGATGSTAPGGWCWRRGRGLGRGTRLHFNQEAASRRISSGILGSEAILARKAANPRIPRPWGSRAMGSS